MRVWLSSSVVLLLLAAPAGARSAPRLNYQVPPLPIERAQMEMPQSQGGPQQMPSQGGMMMPGQGQSGSGRQMGATPEMQRMHEMMMRHMKHEEEEHEHQRGTFIRLKRGDAEIDLHCGADQSLRDCVGAVMTLLDKLASLSGPQSPSH
jgi:hypothetical protein